MTPRPSGTACAAALSAALSAAACGDGAVGVGDQDLVELLGLEPLPEMVHPANNPPNPDRIALGRLLFFDPIMSGPGDVACGTCHMPEFGMSDGRDLPIGTGGEGLGPDRVLTDPRLVPEGRNSPAITNAGFNRFGQQMTPDGFLFWDGRRRRLENLVTLPQRELTEMRGTTYAVEDAVDSVVARLRSLPEYEARFAEAFAGYQATDDAGSAIDSLTLSLALAQFVRSVTSTESPYDRFVAGDSEALTPLQRHGLDLFHGKGGCARCHSGPLFSDFRFHAVGARQLGPGFQQTPHEDFGRWVVTELEEDRWKFRTPTLRNVEHTAPYMHSGGYATLRDVVAFFNRGGGDHPRMPRHRLDIDPLGLAPHEVDALVAFLKALSDPPDVRVPDRVPSGLEPPRLR